MQEEDVKAGKSKKNFENLINALKTAHDYSKMWSDEAKKRNIQGEFFTALERITKDSDYIISKY